jgi:dolichyl-phosphate-mannose-protein mannosyltransferase
MTADVVTALALVAVTIVAIGWPAGFHAVTGYVEFALLCGSAGLTAIRIVRRACPYGGRADEIIRTAILFFALVVCAGLALGSTGLIAPVPYLVFFAGCFVASCFLRRADPRPFTGLGDGAVVTAAVLLPALAFIVAVGIVRSPLTLYDSLSYHLFFPARWLQAHRLSIVPTPFSDEAQAYAPANGELWLLWLMVPFHGDVLARVGQVPFYLLCGVALYALARRAGAKPPHAVYAPAFFFLSRPIVEQAVGADVDLICWAMLLAAMHIGLAAVESDEPADWALFGISLGLYWGSKYVSLVYSPILLALPLLRGPRRRSLWALPGIALLALPWYARNWIVAGSPIYPSSLAIAGVTAARGAYSRAAMAHSVFHTTDARLFPVMLAHAFGTDLFLCWIPLALAGAPAMLAARPRRAALFLAAAPVLMVPLYWFGVPDNVDSRFLLPAAMTALLPIAFVFRANRTWNRCAHAALAAGLVWLVVGRHGELTAQLPWYMGGWLSLDGVVSRAALPVFVALAALAAAIVMVRRTPAHVAARLTGVLGAACVGLTIGSQYWCRPYRCDLLTLSPIYIRAAVQPAWQWLDGHRDQARTVAYTGNNLPYPLVGDHLQSLVVYVNIDRHLRWRFDDYDRARRRRIDAGPPAAVALARSSGVLLPIADAPIARIDAVRPRFERMEGNRDGWVQNMKALGVDCLFVTVLSAYEIDYVSHNAGGFPIEDDWARSDPSSFTLLFANDQVRIYAVHPA